MAASSIASFVVTDGRHFRLRDMNPKGPRHLPLKKDDAPATLAASVARIAELQERLYAHDRWGLLLIFQAMDAAGKDSVIKHVLSGVNPQGCQVASFKAPSSEELNHDFLWRTSARLPERGRIGVFNRSYYEEVLVVRVHPELLANERLPETLVTPAIWKERFEDIVGYERHLARSGFLVRKFFLNVSKDEQQERFVKRLDEPRKRWKFSLGDVGERERWGDYMKAYEDMIRHTSAPHAPWIVVPADRKWLAHQVVATAVVEALESLDLSLSKMSSAQKQDLALARRELESPRAKRS
jgi:PPK2 family polyphosphate:nucleotide phosphotransferase